MSCNTKKTAKLSSLWQIYIKQSQYQCISIGTENHRLCVEILAYVHMGTTMEKLFLTTLIFTLCATKWLTSTAYVLHRVDESIDEDAASISTVNSEVFSRLDYTPCNHANVPALK